MAGMSSTILFFVWLAETVAVCGTLAYYKRSWTDMLAVFSIYGIICVTLNGPLPPWGLVAFIAFTTVPIAVSIIVEVGRFWLGRR